MSFYSRRTFQNMIDENRCFMSEDDTCTILGKLNSGKEGCLPFYWEVFLLNLLSKIGKISHEKNHGGSTNPDVFFMNEKITFLADITTVSDSDQEKKNDYSYFISELTLWAKKRGLENLRGFDIRALGEIQGKIDSKKVKIFLPSKDTTRTFIKEYLGDFIDSIVKDVNSPKKINIENENINICITYNPSNSYTSGGHLSFTSIYSIDKNPIYNALTKKHEQLKKSGYTGIKGVFICDGNCSTLRERHKLGITNFSLEDIVKQFFSKKDKIDFIVVIYIDNIRNYLTNPETYSFGLKIFYAKNEMASFCRELEYQIKQAISLYPPPERTAQNAIYSLKYNGFLPSPSKFGAYSMSDEKITLSARAILELMTGSINQVDFLREHEPAINALRYQLQSGKLPSSVEILKERNQDDDWLIMDFSETTDPCISAFK